MSLQISLTMNARPLLSSVFSPALPCKVLSLMKLDGDLITGENTFLENSTRYVDVIVQPMVQRGIAWASTYGNHDSQFNLSRDALFLSESKYDLSYTQHSNVRGSGATNYYLLVYGTQSTTPVAILWFFDSQGGFPFQTSPENSALPDWVSGEIVSWFETQRDAITNTWGILPSLAFVHIPPAGFLAVQESLLPNIGDKNPHYPGLNDDVPVDIQGSSSGKEDLHFMRALQETKGLKAVFSGHDHGDSWCANWSERAEGPKLCFCKHTGYGGYGNWRRGSRVVSLKIRSGDVEVKSWVRMEDGSLIQKVSLNETYGEDIYPADDGEANNANANSHVL